MIDFSITETLIVEMALKDYLRKDMCKSDRNTCEQAYMKVQLSKKGQQIINAIRWERGNDD